MSAAALRHTPEPTHAVFATNPLQPLIDFFEAILIFFHDLGIGWGMAIVA